jgi:hypothetical protein
MKTIAAEAYEELVALLDAQTATRL